MRALAEARGRRCGLCARAAGGAAAAAAAGRQVRGTGSAAAAGHLRPLAAVSPSVCPAEEEEEGRQEGRPSGGWPEPQRAPGPREGVCPLCFSCRGCRHDFSPDSGLAQLWVWEGKAGGDGVGQRRGKGVRPWTGKGRDRLLWLCR